MKLAEAVKQFFAIRIADAVRDTPNGPAHLGELLTADEAAIIEKLRVGQGKAALAELKTAVEDAVTQELAHLFSEASLALVQKVAAAKPKPATSPAAPTSKRAPAADATPPASDPSIDVVDDGQAVS